MRRITCRTLLFASSNGNSNGDNGHINYSRMVANTSGCLPKSNYMCDRIYTVFSATFFPIWKMLPSFTWGECSLSYFGRFLLKDVITTEAVLSWCVANILKRKYVLINEQIWFYTKHTLKYIFDHLLVLSTFFMPSH